MICFILLCIILYIKLYIKIYHIIICIILYIIFIICYYIILFEGLDEGSRSFADYLRTSDHLRWARTIEKGTMSFLMHICRVQSKCPSPGYVPISGIWEKMGQAHTIEKLRGFAYKPLNIYVYHILYYIILCYTIYIYIYIILF